jgi:hypothetical protein
MQKVIKIEEKALCKAYATMASVIEIAEYFGVSKSVIYKWKVKYKIADFCNNKNNKNTMPKTTMPRIDFINKYCRGEKCHLNTATKNNHWKPDLCFRLGCVLFKEQDKLIYNPADDSVIIAVKKPRKPQYQKKTKKEN